jgi:hypothetical protein
MASTFVCYTIGLIVVGAAAIKQAAPEPAEPTKKHF